MLIENLLKYSKIQWRRQENKRGYVPSPHPKPRKFAKAGE